MILGDVGHLTWGETAVRLVAGAAFGAVVGLEREVDGHEAGLRTHMLLALGSALFGTLSVGAFGSFIDASNANVSFDPSRIASYVVAGIGFLGAGSILKRDDRVHGLTTAASLWVVAAVGLAAGLGFWSGAVVATAIALVTLVIEYPLRHYLSKIKHSPVAGPDEDSARATSATDGAQSRTNA